MLLHWCKFWAFCMWKVRIGLWPLTPKIRDFKTRLWRAHLLDRPLKSRRKTISLAWKIMRSSLCLHFNTLFWPTSFPSPNRTESGWWPMFLFWPLYWYLLPLLSGWPLNLLRKYKIDPQKIGKKLYCLIFLQDFSTHFRTLTGASRTLQFPLANHRDRLHQYCPLHLFRGHPDGKVPSQAVETVRFQKQNQIQPNRILDAKTHGMACHFGPARQSQIQ